MQINQGRKFCPHCSPRYYKNEKLTGIYLKELFPKIKITKNYKIKKNIYNKNKIIRKFIKVDYYFKLNGIKHFIEYNGGNILCL